MRFSTLLICLFFASKLIAQGDNEIQVYASPSTAKGSTMFELHSNYTFKGSKYLKDSKTAHVINETLEITRGIADNFEIGFYTFTDVSYTGKFQYLGNQIRPRVTVPASWKWGVGASLSAEFGFFRPDADSSFIWQGEIRPIIDKTFGSWYFSFNPNIEFVLSGPEKEFGITPQMKAVRTIGKIGIGAEYYSSLGTFSKIESYKMQEHLLGPAIDIYTNPKWEFNFAALFGLTPNSNQSIIKLLIGRRFQR